jgi:hypothetical protein
MGVDGGRGKGEKDEGKWGKGGEGEEEGRREHEGGNH